jgi:MFS family permease
MAANSSADDAPSAASWRPLFVIGLAQMLMVFNVATLQVSIDGISTSFGAPATMVGTAIVVYSLVVAGLIILGARVGEAIGSQRVFRSMLALFGIAMALMAVSPGAITMICAQVLAGVSAAALVPSLVVLITRHYAGRQQSRALGWLGGAQAMGIVLAFLIAGSLATWISWRVTFGLLVLLAAAIFKLSDRLAPIEGEPRVRIDVIGVVLVALAVFFISVGCNNLTDWGVLLASPTAPVAILDMSPAPFMIVSGIFLMQAFVSWSRRRLAQGASPLVALEVIDTPRERSALFCMFAIGALGSAITFLIPLYIQIVQGRSSLQTAVAVIPFSLASFAAAVSIVRLQGRVAPRQIARFSFLLMAAALVLLAAVIRNDWSTFAVVIGMIAAGIGEGALVTLLFNVLVSASRRELAGDVGSLRGTTNNLAAGVGTALAGALVAGVLGSSVHRELVDNPLIPQELKVQVNLDNVAFTSNDQLREALARLGADPAHVDEAVEINSRARLLALKVTFFALAGLSLLAYFPAGRLPARVVQDEVPGSTRDQVLEPGSAASPGSPVI